MVEDAAEDGSEGPQWRVEWPIECEIDRVRDETGTATHIEITTQDGDEFRMPLSASFLDLQRKIEYRRAAEHTGVSGK